MSEEAVGMVSECQLAQRDIGGVSVKDGLQHWNPLLWRWVASISQICGVDPRDPPWWQNEETNTAILGGAALMCGWLSYVESSIPKKVTGRCDLYLKNHAGEMECVEAKLSKNPLELNDAPLIAAENDALMINWKHEKRLIGVAFYALNFPEVPSSTEIESRLNQMKSWKWDAMAWSFPHGTRSLLGKIGVWPGMVLLARVAERISCN